MRTAAADWGPFDLPVLSRNILLLLMILATAALSGTWLWYVSRAEERVFADARQRAHIVTTLALDNMRGTLRSLDLLLEMADRAVVDRDLSTLAADRTVADVMDGLIKRFPDLNTIWLADQNGRIVFGNAATLTIKDLQGSEFFRAHMANAVPIHVGALLGNSDEDRFIPISRRLERSGRFSGVLLAAFSPGWFQRFGQTLALPAEASVTIVTAEGGIVASTEPNVDTLDPALWKSLSSRLSKNTEFATYSVVRPPVTSGGDSDHVMIAYQPLADLNLVALYTVPYTTILQGWSHQLWFGSAIVGLAIFVVIGGTILMVLYAQREGDLHRVLGLRTAEAAQSAERLALAVDTTGIGIFDYNMGGRDITWAGVEASYFGLKQAPALTPRAMLRAVHPADRPNLMKRLRTIRTARDDTRFDTEFRLRHPEFGAIWVAARAKLFMQMRNGQSGGFGRLIGTLRDITERRQLQEHRETVLREINHRIKNSLQLMNSIMNLQSRRIASRDERARFESARRRLISLATVYSHLDDTTRPDVVDLVPFLRRLCQDFSVAYMADGRINLAFTATGATSIPATLAVPLGMAIGEILVGISLDGFAPQASGTVSVHAATENGQIEISVVHNGRSLEHAFSNDGASLGRLLINAFVDQLGGSFSAVDKEPGVAFSIRFRAAAPSSARPMLTAPDFEPGS